MVYPALFLAGLGLFAGCTSPAGGHEPGKVQVTGEAKMTVVPDMVELSLKAYNVQPAMKNAVIETQTAIAQILEVCHKYIPDEEDFKVSNIETNKDYDYGSGHPVFKGYSAQQVLAVKLRDIGRIEQFTEELLATKISSIEDIRYDHSKADSIQRVVNLLSLADAQKTASKMCDQMHVKLGKIVYLSNYPPNGASIGGMRSEGNSYDLNLYSKGFGGRGFKMTSEILEFRDVAFAGFELEQ